MLQVPHATQDHGHGSRLDGGGGKRANGNWSLLRTEKRRSMASKEYTKNAHNHTYTSKVKPRSQAASSQGLASALDLTVGVSLQC